MTSDWPDLAALPGVQDAVGRAEAAARRVHTHPANQRGWARSAAAAAVRAARASAALAGAPIRLEDVVDPANEVVTDPRLAGALRVSAELPGLQSVWARAPLQALARIHVLAAADLAAGDDLGRPRTEDPEMPAGAEVGGRLAGLADLVRAAPWSGPLMVAVVLGELESLAPFGTADGVVARAAARLTAMGTALDPRGLTVPEVGYLRAGPAYQQRLAAYARGEPAGVTGWLLSVCQALEDGAREGLSIADAG